MRLTQCMGAAVLLCAAAASTLGQESRKAIAKPTPRYPEIAKQLKLVGTVKIEVVIGPDGKVKNTNVVGGHPVLIDATLVALKEWKYEPAKSETTATLTFDFRP
ncbi:MAG: TonB-like protein [Candidatus Acidoferrum typicum]|nr:TonB-like protein [Candidatus Acidoferrum typicum]